MYRRLINNKGFTLIELIIVIAIIGILTSISLPLVGKYVIEAQTQSIINDMQQVNKYSNIAIQELNAGGDSFTQADIANRVNELYSIDVKYGYPNLRDKGSSIRILYNEEEKVLKVAYYEGMREPKYEIVNNELVINE